MADKAKLKSYIEANRKNRYAEGAMVDSIPPTVNDDMPSDPQTRAGMSLDPNLGQKTVQYVEDQQKQANEAYQNQLEASRLAEQGQFNTPQAQKVAEGSLGTVMGSMDPLASKFTTAEMTGLQPLQRVQQALGHEVTPAGEVMSRGAAEALLKDAGTALEAGKITPADWQRVQQHYGRSVRKGYAEGGAVDAPQDPQTQAGMSIDPNLGQKTVGYIKDQQNQAHELYQNQIKASRLAEQGQIFTPESEEVGKGALNTAIGSLGPQSNSEMMELEHYSPTAGLKEVDPAYMGTGVRGEEWKTKPMMPHASYYVKGGGEPEAIVKDAGKNKYTTSILKSSIYDLAHDPEGFVKAAQSPYGGIDMDEARSAIKGAGYKGVVNSQHPTHPHIVQVFDKLPVSQDKGSDVIRDLAKNYASSKGLNLEGDISKADPALGAEIAQAYESMPHNPNAPYVKRAYDALKAETDAQYKLIKKSGMKLEEMPPSKNPYPNGSADMAKDIHENNHLYYKPSEGDLPSDHPLNADTTEKLNGRTLKANDQFRIVHDIFGHAKEGNSFGPHGEEAAWQIHSRMYSPEARRALTTETRGQNSWVNFGPKGEANRANPANTTYAEQKANILPAKYHGIEKKNKYAEGGEVSVTDGSPADIATPDMSQYAPQGVNVISPEGELGSLPHEQAQEALAAGYRLASPEEVDTHFKEEQYGTIWQQVKAGLEGVAEGVAGPFATAIETGLGVKPEDIRARAEVNPITHGIGQGAGLVGGALAGVGEGAVLEGAGQGLRAALPIGKGTFLSQVGPEAAKAAFEGALFQGGEEIGKKFKQDPNQSASSAMLDIGLSAILGGAFGGPIGAALGKAKQIGMNLPQVAEPAFVSEVDRPLLEAGDLAAHTAIDDTIPPARKASLLESLKLSKQKGNAKEISDAAKTLGAPSTPGMLLESPLIQMQLDSLAHSPYTYSGSKIRGALDNAYGVAEGELEKATASANNLTKDQLGQGLQQSFDSDIRQAYAPVQAAFKEVSDLHPSIPVSPDDLTAFKEGVEEIREVALGPSTDEGRLARQVIRAVDNAKTADDISVIRNMSALKKNGLGADPMGRIKGIIRDRLQDLQDSVVDSYAKSFPRNDEAGALMSTLIDAHANAQQMYKPYIRKVGQLAEWLGKGKIHGTEDALNFMTERLSPSDVANRLFSSSKDPQFLRFFEKEFPQQFQVVRDYQRAALKESASVAGEFSPKSFFKKFNNLPTELQESLYSKDEIKKINAAETYIRDAFPKDYNGSHTAHAIAMKEAYSGGPKSMVLANARDFAMEKVIAAADGLGANAITLAKATIAGEKASTKAVKSLFDKASSIPLAALPVIANRAKLDKLIQTLAANPDKMFDLNKNNPIPEYAQAFSTSANRAVQYLSSIKPRSEPSSPLDTKIPPTPAQKADYERALDIAQHPLVVIDKMKKGTFTVQDLTALQSLHPEAYQNLKTKVMTEVMNQVHKGQAIPYSTRMQLSLFLGQPLDSTMTPQAILNAQAKRQNAPQAPMQGGGGKAKGNLSKLGGIAKSASTAVQSRESARSGHQKD